MKTATKGTRSRHMVSPTHLNLKFARGVKKNESILDEVRRILDTDRRDIRSTTLNGHKVSSLRFRVDSKEFRVWMTKRGADYLIIKIESQEGIGVEDPRFSREKPSSVAQLGENSFDLNLKIVRDKYKKVWPDDLFDDWLHGANPRLGGARPIDHVRTGNMDAVFTALTAELWGAIG